MEPPIRQIPCPEPAVFFAAESDFAPGRIFFGMLHAPEEAPDQVTPGIPEPKAYPETVLTRLIHEPSWLQRHGVEGESV